MGGTDLIGIFDVAEATAIIAFRAYLCPTHTFRDHPE